MTTARSRRSRGSPSGSCASTRRSPREIEGVSRAVAERLGKAVRRLRARCSQAGVASRGAASLSGSQAPHLPSSSERDGRIAVALPGPPNELRRLWPRVLEADALKRLLARVDAPRHRVLRFFGPSESAVARALEEAGGEGDGLEVTVCAHDLEIRVDLLNAAGGEEPAPRVEAALRERFGAELFADDERPVAELVLDRCRALGLTLATAESCTGGLVGARLTDVAGASDVFLGGIVAYSNEAKMRQLGVPARVLERHGAVSAEAAEAMAEGARAALGADVAVSVTGIAGPGRRDAGEAGRPRLHLRRARRAGSSTERVVFSGDREAVRARATAHALHTLRRLL